jgi:hypothetical protein
MIAPLILVVILCFLEPGFTFLLHRLQYQGLPGAFAPVLAPVASGSGCNGTGYRRESPHSKHAPGGPPFPERQISIQE